MNRQLYLVAYDIREPKRLRRTHQVLKDYACGGQKSAFECYLSNTERKELGERIEQCMDMTKDTLLLIRLNTTDNVNALGVAAKPADELYTYLG